MKQRYRFKTFFKLWFWFSVILNHCAVYALDNPVSFLNLWPQEEFYQISPTASEMMKERVTNLMMRLRSSGDSRFVFLLPKSFLIRSADSNPELLNQTQKLIDQIKNQSPLGKTLIEKINFSADRIIYIFTNENQILLNSWTESHSKWTFLVVNRDTFNKQNLLSSLSHEIGLSADGKIKKIEKLNTQLESENPRSESYIVIMNPNILTAFTTMRAFAIEQQILSDMGLRSINPIDSSKSCLENIESIIQIQTNYQIQLRSNPLAFLNFIYLNWLNTLYHTAEDKFSIISKLTDPFYAT